MRDLQHEWELENPLPEPMPGVYNIPLEEGVVITASSLSNGGIKLSAQVVDIPPKEEEFFEQALLGNLFGQGTNGAVLGLTEDGKRLTLSRTIDYDVNYKEFRDLLEDFINSVDFWKSEVLNYR